jgi:ABC-2 type transport system ATP-binding protein
VVGVGVYGCKRDRDDIRARRKIKHEGNSTREEGWTVSVAVASPLAVRGAQQKGGGSVTDLAIVTEGLTKSYGKVQAVTDVTMSVERGSIVGLLGPNGSGKTTVIRMLATLLKPTSGSAKVGGFDIRTNAADVRRCIGLTGQFAAVDAFLTGRESITMMARLAGMTPAAAKVRADELLTSFGLQDAGDRHLSTYSGGMSRRLVLAVSLTGHPDIVFLDEPTTGLDPRSRFAIWQVIESLVADGTTILLSTQYLEEADQLAQRVVILDTGRVVAEGAPAALRKEVGGIVVRFTLHDESERRRAVEALAPIAVRPIAGDSGDPNIEVPVNDAEQLAAVVRLLDAAAVVFSGLALHEPTLDDVFLALTGHRSALAPEEKP